MKNLDSNVSKMNNTKLLMICMKPKDEIKPDTVKLYKTYPEENVLPKMVYRFIQISMPAWKITWR